jgi:hypothetical protein
MGELELPSATRERVKSALKEICAQPVGYSMAKIIEERYRLLFNKVMHNPEHCL